jgi:hypothetical protein
MGYHDMRTRKSFPSCRWSKIHQWYKDQGRWWQHIRRHHNSLALLEFVPYISLLIHAKQLPYKFVTLVGGIILKVIWTMRHTTLAKFHTNRCCIDSPWLKTTFLLHFHFLFAKLSFVSRTLEYKNHINTLIFSGILIFQI